MTTNLLLLYCDKWDTPNNEFVSNEQIVAMSSCFSVDSWNVSIAKYSPESLLATITEYEPKIIFNLAYGYTANGNIESQPDTAKRIESHGLVCIGAQSSVQYLAQDKKSTAIYLNQFGIRSPDILTKERMFESHSVVVAKPRFGACHRGVQLLHKHEDVEMPNGQEEYLFQEYIDGPEFTVAVIERDGKPYAFSPIQIKFEEPNNNPCILVWDQYRWTYAQDTEDRFNLRNLATRVFESLEFRDYGRFDFRVSTTGPVLLDANVLPNLDPQRSLLPMAARMDGIGYDALVNLIAESARLRISALKKDF